MALACTYTTVFTKQVQNRASALNIVQIKDESLKIVVNIMIIIIVMIILILILITIIIIKFC